MLLKLLPAEKKLDGASRVEAAAIGTELAAAVPPVCCLNVWNGQPVMSTGWKDEGAVPQPTLF